MAGEPAPGARGRGRGRAGRSSVLLRKRAECQLDVMARDPVGREAAVWAIPGRDAVEGGQDEGRGNGRVRRQEGADRDTVIDRRPEATLVGIATLRDGVSTVRGEVAPLGDEDAGALRVR